MAVEDDLEGRQEEGEGERQEKQSYPDTSSPFHDNRRFCLYGGLMCLIALIMTGVVVVVLERLDSTTSSPSDTPVVDDIPEASPDTREVSIRETLADNIGPADMIGAVAFSDQNGEDTPYSKAMDFILYDDRLNLNSSSPNLVQRYVLTLFYYKTAEQAPWASCNPPNQGRDETSECLAVDNSTVENTNVTTVEGRWLSDKHECDWAWIECDEKTERVIAIDLIGQNLTGTIPVELMHLERLLWLTLTANHLTGTIPEAWGDGMKHLVFFEVAANLLSGRLPPGFFGRPSVLQYSLPFNEFTGTIPTQIGEMEQLNSLFMYNTLMEGPLPSEIGSLRNARKLHLYDNFFSASLPTQIGRLRGLRELLLGGNAITGTIPSELGGMNRLQWLRLDRNRISGTLPEELFSIPSLEYLELFLNNLDGPLSSQAMNSTSLIGLKINDNRMMGSVPGMMFTNMRSLQLLWLQRNEFTGEIPGSICRLRVNGVLDFLNADCNGGGLNCSCCTACCNDLGVCAKTVGA